ncbi:hypothetical protein SPI_00468 [Niveomyces insectorum RCEF 264]|uniref:Uncharacterized protein n=1 Tax=Niveomyces insectorum RCEF 264 TaxID=1081102 RepID=A0A168A5I0_9HYPO|nr:hypothetical protein SPI_00468 [Niveomyces insectorum RCEF 264]
MPAPSDDEGEKQNADPSQRRPSAQPKPPHSPNATTPPTTRWMSNILPLNLEDHPASGRGRYSTVSVLEPVMRIERTGEVEATGIPIDAGASASYRIVVAFVFEVAIFGFEQGPDRLSFQKYNRFFDSVSVRYLFRQGDLIELRPHSDAAAKNIQVTKERDKSSSLDAGVSPGMVSAVAPNLSIQVQRDFRLTYQRSMNSWRMGLSFEEYPVRETRSVSLPLGSRLAACLLPKQQQQPPQTWANRRRWPRQDLQQHSFRVSSPHAHGCHCHMQHRHHTVCAPGAGRAGYNRAARWFWQTEASLRLWTPEIYSRFRCPITVMREVPVATIDALRRLDDVRPYLHFDFEVDTQLRVLGCGFNFFKSATKPAELRAQTDTGQPLPPDHVRFCVTCCAENISWPLYPTRNLQAEAETGALGPAQSPCRLQTNAEFYAYLKKQRERESAKADSPATPSQGPHRPSPTPSASVFFPYTPGNPPPPPPIVTMPGRAAHPVVGNNNPGSAHNGPYLTASQAAGSRCQHATETNSAGRRQHCSHDCRNRTANQPHLGRELNKSPSPSTPSSELSLLSPLSSMSLASSSASPPSPLRASPPVLQQRTSSVPVPRQTKDLSSSEPSSIKVSVTPMLSPRSFVDGSGLTRQLDNGILRHSNSGKEELRDTTPQQEPPTPPLQRPPFPGATDRWRQNERVTNPTLRRRTSVELLLLQERKRKSTGERTPTSGNNTRRRRERFSPGPG